MSGSEGEKSFAPSEKRKRDAAGKGDVLRSRELATAGAMLAGTAWLVFAGPWLLHALTQNLRTALVWDRTALEEFSPGGLLASLLLPALIPVALLGIATALVSLFCQIGIGDGRWIGANLAPKASRINPLAGLKRMFGPTGWIEMAKGLAKIWLLGTISWIWGSDAIAGSIGLGRGEVWSQLSTTWDALIRLLFALSGGLVLIALVDLPVQWVRRNQRLKMTLQEMRDEHKEAEGSPERKAAIRDRQRKIASGGLVPAVKEAQFILTNPTHFAVALSYDPAKAAAPVVLARGRGDKALAMRDLAAEHAVPVLEYPQLARAIYYSSQERQQIREELFMAVATILAFVLALRRGEHPAQPQVNVPVTLRFDAEGRIEVVT